jgi:transcription elongation factor Elf1
MNLVRCPVCDGDAEITSNIIDGNSKYIISCTNTDRFESKHHFYMYSPYKNKIIYQWNHMRNKECPICGMKLYHSYSTLKNMTLHYLTCCNRLESHYFEIGPYQSLKELLDSVRKTKIKTNVMIENKWI